MNKVKRDELLDYITYSEKRDQIRQKILREKEVRRIHVAPYLTFLFENHATIAYQIQEMMRAEQIVKEADIEHEISTYNELIGEKGVIGCTLLIEIEDKQLRATLLTKLKDLPQHIYLLNENGEKTYAQYDSRQVGEKRLSSVQFLKFNCKESYPVAIGVDHADLTGQIKLSQDNIAALKKDLQ